MGAYASLLQVLQLESGLDRLAYDDPLGRQLQDKESEIRTRARAHKPQLEELEAAAARPKAASRSDSKALSGAGVSSEDLLKLLEIKKVSTTKPNQMPRKSKRLR